MNRAVFSELICTSRMPLLKQTFSVCLLLQGPFRKLFEVSWMQNKLLDPSCMQLGDALWVLSWSCTCSSHLAEMTRCNCYALGCFPGVLSSIPLPGFPWSEIQSSIMNQLLPFWQDPWLQKTPTQSGCPLTLNLKYWIHFNFIFPSQNYHTASCFVPFVLESKQNQDFLLVVLQRLLSEAGDFISLLDQINMHCNELFLWPTPWDFKHIEISDIFSGFLPQSSCVALLKHCLLCSTGPCVWLYRAPGSWCDFIGSLESTGPPAWGRQWQIS